MNVQHKHFFAFIVLVLFAATVVTITAADEEKVRYRSDVLKELESAEAAFIKATDDDALQKKYATLLYQTGDFWKAKEIINPLLEKSKDVETLMLGARLAYLMGDYSDSEKRFSHIMKIAEKDSDEYNKALEHLVLTYFQTHQYAKARELPQIDKLKDFLDAMKKFPGNPYEIEWGNVEKIATLPYEIKGMLPSMKVEVNGKELEFILDTGGNLFYIDKVVAEECGLNEGGS